jgi:hypothetical protein
MQYQCRRLWWCRSQQLTCWAAWSSWSNLMQEEWKQCCSTNDLLEVVVQKLAPPRSNRSYKWAVAQSYAPKKLDRPPTRAGVAARRCFRGMLSRVLCAQRLTKGMQKYTAIAVICCFSVFRGWMRSAFYSQLKHWIRLIAGEYFPILIH